MELEVVTLGLQLISISDITACHIVCCARFIFGPYDGLLDLNKATNPRLSLQRRKSYYTDWSGWQLCLVPHFIVAVCHALLCGFVHVLFLVVCQSARRPFFWRVVHFIVIAITIVIVMIIAFWCNFLCINLKQLELVSISYYEGRLISNAHSEISRKREHVFKQTKVGSKVQYFSYKLTYLFFDIVALSFNTFFPT